LVLLESLSHSEFIEILSTIDGDKYLLPLQ
jgi:hypothetical protein